MTALNTYITSRFTVIGSQLGWTSTEYANIEEDTLETMGITDESEESDLKKIHAFAKVQALKKALLDVSLDYSFSADGSSYQRNQISETLRKNLIDAETELLSYNPDYVVSVGKLIDKESPYDYDYDRDSMGNI